MGERDAAGSGLEATMLGQSGSHKESTERDLAGTRLRHFQVVRLIGRGGMGTVYLGHDTSLDRPVALKVLAPDIAHDPSIVQRFVLEAQAQARLSHPNVVQMYFVGEDAGVHFFAMEYVEGPALDTILKGDAKVAWPDALGYAISAAKGLKAAHGAGFIHRDVKPSNLLLDANAGVKIFDFGLVKSLHGDSELTREGAIVGSPYYMAPEQGRSEAVDLRSDIYALGCTLYHLLCGRPPFEAPSPVGVISMHVTERAKPVRSLAPEAPLQLERTVEQMMAKSPGDRFADYDALLAALEAARPGVRSFSGFWSRATALTLDLAPLCLLSLFLGWWVLPLGAIYFIAGHALFGATLGKRLIGLTVFDPDGSLIGWRTSAIRFFAFAWGPLCAAAIFAFSFFEYRHDHLTLGFDSLNRAHLATPLIYAALLMVVFVGYLAGFLVSAFHPKHQALHDLIAHTVVARRPR